MWQKKLMPGILIVLGSIVYLVLRCAPLDPSTTLSNVDIILESSTLQWDDDFIEDSIGNPIRIGITCFLPEYIDSIELLVTTPTNQTVVDTMFIFDSTVLKDTLWKTVTFWQPGTKNVTLYAYSSLTITPVKATLYIRNKNLPTNVPPSITVAGNRTIRPGEPCSLSITVSDPDSSQKASLSLGQHPEGSTVQGDSLFVWTPPSDYSGIDTVEFIVTDNGLVPATNSRVVVLTVTNNPNAPTLIVSGDRTLTPASVCVLLLSAADADSGQTVRVSAVNSPEGSSIVDGNLFMWEIPSDFSGRDTIVFTATDDGMPPKSATDTAIIIVSENQTNLPPVWTDDTLTVLLTDLDSFAVDLAEKCSDADGDAVHFTLQSSLVGKDTLDGTWFRYWPATGTDTSLVAFVYAADDHGGVDTMVLKVTVTRVVIDNDPPVIVAVEPSGDSAQVNSSSISITVAIHDASGIDMVVCTMGDSTFDVTHTDTLYTAIVSGLKEGVFNRIAFTVSDASIKNNENSMLLYVKYDPTMADYTRPVLRRIEPFTDSTVVGSDAFTFSLKANDVSGIASVTGTTGSTTFAVTGTDSTYTATVTGLTKNRYNRIVAVVTDGSSNSNRDSLVYHVYYDPTFGDSTPPVIMLHKPAKDSSVSATASIVASVRSEDAHGVASVVFRLGTALFPAVKTDSVYTATITGLVALQYNRIVVVATDSATAANRDTALLYVKYDPTLADTFPPKITRYTPARDSSIVGVPIASIATIITDRNGVALVVCSMNGSTFGVSHTDSVYSATITGLVANSYNRIVVTATDSSSNANRDSVVYFIYYDPTYSDTEPPVLLKNSPNSDSSITGTLPITVTINVSDASGVKAVTCKSGSTSVPVAGSGTLYSATISGLVENVYTPITFVATDASTSENNASIVLYIKYDPTFNDHTPPTLWPISPADTNSTVATSSLSLTIGAFDGSGIKTVTYNGSNVQRSGNQFTAAISGLTTSGDNVVTFIATDSSTHANKDTLRYHIKYDPTVNDHTTPTLKRITPKVDSSVVSANNLTVTISAEDAQGIASVVSSGRTVSQNGINYSVSVANLQINAYTRVSFVATDASSNSNRDSIVFYIKYDPTVDDNVPPVITPNQWGPSGSTMSIASMGMGFYVTDASGVDTVWWSFNGVRQSGLIAESNGAYTISVTLLHGVKNRIVLYATDRATVPNTDSLEWFFYYNQKPVAIAGEKSTKRATPLTFDVTASDPDNDPIVAWKIIKQPTHGTISGTLPSVTYTPTGNYEGPDEFTFRVWDAYDSSFEAGKVSIVINSKNIAPVIGAPPQSVTVDEGTNVIFTVAINSDAFPAPEYRWYKGSLNATPVVTTAPQFTLSAVTLNDAGQYILVVSNSAGSDESAPFTLLVNPEVNVGFTESNGSGVESKPMPLPAITVMCTPAPATGQVVSIGYTLTGTAQGSGGDFNHEKTGTITFSAAGPGYSFMLEMINDNVFEDDENVIITLSNPVGCNLGGVTHYTYTIINDDIGSIAYVCKSGAEPSTGASWKYAFHNLQDALSAARVPQSPIKEIHVATGTYYPDETGANPLGTNERSSTFAMVDGVSILGGYPVGGGVRNSDPLTNETVLSGNIDHEIGNNDLLGNSYHVVTGANGVVDGFTITGGYADGEVEMNGGGIIVKGSHILSLNNCRFYANSAHSGGGAFVAGGTVAFDNCTFERNGDFDNRFEFTAGGGLYATAFEVHEAVVTINRSKFINNISSMDGGAISSADGIMKIANSVFKGNTTGDYGGGAIASTGISTIITGSDFVNNTSGASWGGGAVKISGPRDFGNVINSTIDKCTFASNTAVEGGAIYYRFFTGTHILRNSVFIGNTAQYSGGAVCYINAGESANPMTVINCTFSGNDAKSPNSGGGAISSFSSVIAVKNSIFWNNSSQNPTADYRDVYIDELSSRVISYCDLQQDEYAGTNGNISVDPLFINSPPLIYSDTKITANSRCINVGTSAGAPLDDITGASRDEKPDVGAYEFR